MIYGNERYCKYSMTVTQHKWSEMNVVSTDDRTIDMNVSQKVW